MEFTDREVEQIKWIYDAYYGGRLHAEDALAKLEELINGNDN